ncbi:hypothetical protein [Dyadobacter sp. OTU695]|uniref:hypothetical protein n=1 Tax=Dyadobacter sp. OTU695 TaxID=3043860 RepID=UPI00313BF2C5
MKTQHLLLRTSRAKITSALFAAALLCGSSAAFAQVKIGTNPTTIEPNSNLEVEASTPGRKTKIDKTTGQVTITDGTEGAGKVLTSDAAGGASWQSPAALINGAPGSQVNVTNNVALTYSGGSLVLPKAGTYMVSTRWFTLDPVTSFTTPNIGYVNINPSTSESTVDMPNVGAAEWLFITHGMYHNTPAFKVTVTGPQTIYLWFNTGFFTGKLQFDEIYAVGPF